MLKVSDQLLRVRRTCKPLLNSTYSDMSFRWIVDARGESNLNKVVCALSVNSDAPSSVLDARFQSSINDCCLRSRRLRSAGNPYRNRYSWGLRR